MADPINLIAQWLRDLFTGWGMVDGLVNVIVAAIGVIVLCTFTLVVAIFLVWVERKVVARFQDRLGPNRLGPYGLIQPFADIVKLLVKEDTTPAGADRFIYNLAPIIALATVLSLWAVIPLSPYLVGSNLNVGVLYIVAIGAISTLGIIMAGWASNNKYALLGAARTVAQMVSYEVPMVVSLLVPVILARSMGIQDIASAQSSFWGWYIFSVPLAAVIFLITSIAEIGRSPFDLTEAESEIVAGFHIEYSGMKFGLFYAGELLHALTIGALFSALFLGGWRGPFVDQVPFLGIIYLFIKAFFIYWVIMWIKYTVPRIRIDHMLNFNWKFLTPVSISLVILVAIIDRWLYNATWFLELDQSFGPVVYWLLMLSANILVAWVSLSLARRFGQSKRQRVAEPRPVARPDNPPVVDTLPSGD
ncbi:MAG: NADH-quinone oxidoreductase subunit NuoH [Anaerolineales bacterium]|nr:NADH-quinone oxidoreductase subunit NuoH [Anaerolineales bacterium]